MKFIKMKKALPLALIVGMLMVSGCQSEAQVENSESKVEKNVLITEENTIQNMEVTKNVNKEQAKEIAIKAFEKYLNKKLDVKNLFEETELLKGDKNNDSEKDYWVISWSTFDPKRLENIDEKTEDEIEKLSQEYDKSINYCAAIEENSGNILGILAVENRRMSIEELNEIKTEDAKDIALDYIKKNKLVYNVDDLKFFGDVKLKQGVGIEYEYGENNVITVGVNPISKEVYSFSFENKE